MTRDGKISVAIILLCTGTLAAIAANDTIGVTAGSGKTANLISFGGGNVISEVGICDATTANQCAAVSAGGAVSASAAQSGTWNITNVSGTVSLPTGASTAAKQPALGTAGTASADVLTVQGIASMTPLLATVTNAGTFAVQASIPTWAGGTLGAMANYGTSPGAVLVPGINAFVTNTNANGQAVMASSSPVALASNQSVGDPCMFQAKSQKNINTASGTTLLVAASGSTKVYVCSFAVVAPSAVSVSLSEGTGATCNTANQAGVMGVAVNGTAANGMPFAANGGMTYGNGQGTVAFTATAANALCLFQSGTAQLAGNLTYVQQ